MIRPCYGHRCNTTKPPVSARVLGQRLAEDLRVEIRPQAVDEVQFRVRALPEQEIAQALLASRTYQEIDRRRRHDRVIDLGETLDEACFVSAAFQLQTSTGLQQAVLRGVVDGDPQVHARTVGGGALTVLDRLEQARIEP